MPTTTASKGIFSGQDGPVSAHSRRKREAIACIRQARRGLRAVFQAETLPARPRAPARAANGRAAGGGSGTGGGYPSPAAPALASAASLSQSSVVLGTGRGGPA